MKIILNKDVAHLGEEGDVKNVASGYMRNYLRPRNLAVPYNPETVALFESRRADIEARKEQKRKDSASLKEKLESLDLVVEMSAGTNGKLYGAVSALTVSDLLLKNGYQIERRRIEIPGVTIKNVGNYTISVKLYESQVAQVKLHVKVQGDADKTEGEKAEDKKTEEKKPEVKAEQTSD